MPAEQLDDLLGFAEAQHPDIDKDAGQLVPDGLVQQGGGDRRIDAARQAQHDIAVADLPAQPVDDLRVEQCHRPVAAAAGEVVRKIAQQFRPLRRVRDLGMKQGAVEPAAVVGDRGIGCRFARRDGAEPGRQRLDLVAMAHPHLGPRTLWPQPVEQQAIVGNIDKGAAEFLVLGKRNAAAQLVAHRLHAIADAEHRHAELEDEIGRARRGHMRDRSRATRQDDRARVEVPHLAVIDRIGMDLAINAAFAHPARDQLRHLAAEIEDQDAVGH